MILKTQYVELVWSKYNRKKYTDKGYVFTGIGTKLMVNPIDLPKKSEQIVTACCDICGKDINVSYGAYRKNILKNNCYVCQICSISVRHQNDVNRRCNERMIKLNDVAKKNGYSILSKSEDLQHITSYVTYLCNKHGPQTMRVGNFLSGKHCPECANDRRKEMFKNPLEKVQKMIDDCGGTILNIDEYVNQDMCNLLFICPECGKKFLSSLKHYKQHGGRLCGDCVGKESLGEKKVRDYLESNKIDYEQEKHFADCRDKATLPFDFYLPGKNTVIEFDGRQHYTETNFFSYSIDQTMRHDTIKNNYCKNKGICLIRIPYTHINHITEILDSYLHKDIV